jgi:hypothetical protein
LVEQYAKNNLRKDIKNGNEKTFVVKCGENIIALFYIEHVCGFEEKIC